MRLLQYTKNYFVLSTSTYDYNKNKDKTRLNFVSFKLFDLLKIFVITLKEKTVEISPNRLERFLSFNGIEPKQTLTKKYRFLSKNDYPLFD